MSEKPDDTQPRYWGDGVHDDTPHLQWMIDRLPHHGILVADERPHYTLTPLDFSRCYCCSIELSGSIAGKALFKEDIGLGNYIRVWHERDVPPVITVAGSPRAPLS